MHVQYDVGEGAADIGAETDTLGDAGHYWALMAAKAASRMALQRVKLHGLRAMENEIGAAPKLLWGASVSSPRKRG